MLIDVHAHIFPRIHGQTAAGPTRGRGYGRIRIGRETLQALPPCGSRTAFSAATLIAHMDWARVDRALLLQGPYYGACNQYVEEALQLYPARLWGAACLDPWAEDAPALWASGQGLGAFRAVKLECSVPTGLCGLYPEADLGAPALNWLWHALESTRRVLVLDLGGVGSRSYQTEAVRAIALRHPALRIVIAHLGQPTPRAEADPALWAQWCAQIDLGLLPNVWFDCAALPAYVAEEGYPFPTAGRYLRQAIERIGADRVMWGTDLPGMLVHATYPQLAQLALEHTRFLSQRERALMLGGNALRVYAGV